MRVRAPIKTQAHKSNLSLLCTFSIVLTPALPPMFLRMNDFVDINPSACARIAFIAPTHAIWSRALRSSVTPCALAI